jgi:predicted acylesterase/phospholipase RssA
LVTSALVVPALGFLLQFRLLETSGLMLRFLYLARVPLIILLVLATFGPIALGPAVDLLGGILVASNFIGIFWTTAAASALVFACGAQINIVRAHGWERVQHESLRDLDHPVISSGMFWTGVVAAGSLLFAVGLVSLSLSAWLILAGVATGAVTMLTLIFVFEFGAAWLSVTPPGHTRHEPAVPFRHIPLLAKLLDAAQDTGTPDRSPQGSFVGSLVARLVGSNSGYVEALSEKGHRILPAHTFAATHFLLTNVVFWIALYVKLTTVGPSYTESARSTEAAFQVPTVTSIVLLLFLSGWVLAAITFFFDRYRTPLFTIALVAAVTSGSWSHTDYTVATVAKPEPYALATPGQVMSVFGDRPLVIAAAGGGIQAGAWTARVLHGLDEHLNGTLRNRLAMISSVSGGSMGALYFGAYEGEQTLAQPAEQALKSSLDEVATTVVGRDIFRILGLRFAHDRGAALEGTWEERLPPAQREGATLRNWSQRARDFALGQEGARPFPAFLFNTTIVESGQPMAFATTQFPTAEYRRRFEAKARQYPAVESANRVLRLAKTDDAPARDIGVKAVTAARLSAAFPYVSPAATLRIPNVEPFHLVDGAYYDNYGLVALSQWVDDALEELAGGGRGLPREVGVVIATGLVSSDSALSQRLWNGDVSASPLDSKVAPRGWRWQLTAPPYTALNARTFAQWAGSMQALLLLKDKWAGRVNIVPYVFGYPGEDSTPVCQGAPLSWKLTSPQQKCIEKAWKTFESNHDSALWRLQ